MSKLVPKQTVNLFGVSSIKTSGFKFEARTRLPSLAIFIFSLIPRSFEGYILGHDYWVNYLLCRCKRP